jgi:hypothetical protein
MTPETQEKILIVACAIAIPTLAYLFVRKAVQVNAREGTLTPGSTPVTVVNTSPTGPCRAIPQWSFHLRPVMQAGTENAQTYPVGTELQLLQAPQGALTRRGAKMYKVKVVRDGHEGFVFLYDNEIVGDCRPAA